MTSKVKVTLIMTDAISNMMISAMESGDPVTTASRGGWCVAINNRSRKAFEGEWWYADPQYFNGPFSFEVVELDDEESGHVTKHKVRPIDVARGLTVMAMKFRHHFAKVLADNTDAPCADIFLQCILFGKEKYA